MLLITTEPFVFVYNLVFSINMIVLPQLVFKKSCNQLYNSTICEELSRHHDNNFKHEQDIVQEHSSLWMLILLMSTLFPTMFTVLIWGPIADIIGRKRAMAVPPIFLGVQSIIYYLNSTVFVSSSIGYLIFGAFSTSIYGDFQGAYALAYSYMADVTEKSSKRTMRMAILEGIMFISGAPAGLISGYILQNLGFGPVFITTGCMSGAMLIYICCILPSPKQILEPGDCERKSGTEEIQQSSSEEEEMPIVNTRVNEAPSLEPNNVSLNPFVHLKTVYLVIGSGNRSKLLIPLLLSFGFSLIAISGELYITVLYTKHRPFNFSPEQIGYYMVFLSVARGIGAIVLPQIAVRCCRWSDYILISFGLLSQTANYLLVGLANSKLMLYLVTISGIGIGVATSGIRSLITKQVDNNSYGSALAAIEFMDAFGAFLGNIISNSIYNGTIATFSGLAFFILAIFSSISLSIIVSVWICCKPKRTI
eukprot:gene7895-8749_t